SHEDDKNGVDFFIAIHDVNEYLSACAGHRITHIPSRDRIVCFDIKVYSIRRGTSYSSIQVVALLYAVITQSTPPPYEQMPEP
ncbi:8184_t:CDS:1, partial [Paraglomus occultum]